MRFLQIVGVRGFGVQALGVVWVYESSRVVTVFMAAM